MLHAVRTGVITGVIRDTAGWTTDRAHFAHPGIPNRLDPPRRPF